MSSQGEGSFEYARHRVGDDDDCDGGGVGNEERGSMEMERNRRWQRRCTFIDCVLNE